MELLSPAGNLYSAYAAFKGGADAIYIGGKRFSARASAENFSDDEIKEITFYAHSIGRKVYVTLNTLLFQDEFFDAVEFAKFLYTINIDGIIIQDLGLANYLHSIMPELPLNASTQLNCHNIKQAQALVKIGFKRIVLAREANIEFVKQVKQLGVEVEVFGHGALCVSYSGNCLMSSFIGDRSGNRGRCAQPCRMKYDLLEDNRVISKSTFTISTKDLMTLDNIDELIDAGVDSLKLEGRLKSNEYIYLVSKSYRTAIDLYGSKKNLQSEKKDLISIFNRQFTKGFILNESPFKTLNNKTSSHQGEKIGTIIKAYKNRIAIKLDCKLNRLDGIRFNGGEQFGLTVEKMFLNREPVETAYQNQIIELSGIENPERFLNQEVIKTKDICLIQKIEKELNASLRVNVIGEFKAEPEKELSLTIKYNDVKITVKGNKGITATNTPTSDERIKDQLSKSGDYPYKISNLSVNNKNCFIPISELNELRNKAYEKLKESLIKINNLRLNDYNQNEYVFTQQPEIKSMSETVDQFDACNEYGIETYTSFDKDFNKENRVTNKNNFNAENELLNFVINKENNGMLIASQYCNITNSYTLDCFYNFGFNECILSAECDLNSLNLMLNNFKQRHGYLPNVGYVIYGKLDMMIMKSCPIGTHYNNSNIKCNRCKNHHYELVDRIGEHYTLISDDSCNIRVLQNKPIYLLDKFDELKNIGVSVGYLLFTDEQKEKVSELLTNFYENNRLVKAPNRGHYNKRPL